MRRFGFLTIAAAIVLGASGCGGGGGSSTPGPAPTLAGRGNTTPLDQHVSFTLVVPPTATMAAVSRGVRLVTAGNPYVSPATASVSIALVSIDGSAPATAPSATTANVPPPCVGSAGGCRVAIAGVPAGNGVDRYLVQTFSLPGATGDLISSAFVDVTVPTAASATLGGTTLTTGGFVAAVSFSPARVALTLGIAGRASVITVAKDAAGAIIVGSPQFVTPISVTSSDTSHFKLNGTPAVTFAAGAGTLDVAYDGNPASLGDTVTASSRDGAGNGVTATLPVVLAPPIGTTPPPVTPPPVGNESLYVIDGANDHILEYDTPKQLASGSAPAHPTPKRVISFLKPSNTTCAQVQAVFDGVAIDAAGSIYAASNVCRAASLSVIFRYAPTSVGATLPSGTFAIPNSVIQTTQLAYDSGGNRLFVGGGTFSAAPTPIITFALAGGAPVVQNEIATTCLLEPGFGTCGDSPDQGITPGPGVLPNSALTGDTIGNAYAGVVFGPLSPSAYPNGNGVAVVSANATSANPLPQSVLVGPKSQLGVTGNSQGSFALAVDGLTLYVLANATEAVDYNATTFAGLAACVPHGARPMCADGFTHDFILAYDLRPLLAPGAGPFVDLAPIFVIGADPALAVSRFSCTYLNAGTSEPFLAARGGFVYVVSQLGPDCTSDPTVTPYPGEVDVYDTRNVHGYSTTVAPYVISDPNVEPAGVAIGTAGTVTGGQALIHQRLAHPHLLHRSLRPAARR